jgi:hypothetical protein
MEEVDDGSYLSGPAAERPFRARLRHVPRAEHAHDAAGRDALIGSSEEPEHRPGGDEQQRPPGGTKDERDRSGPLPLA